jgi:CubicO group peptidase (beta-lactamase class C family)
MLLPMRLRGAVALVVVSACGGQAAPAVPPVASLPVPPEAHVAKAAPAIDPSGDWDIRWDRGFSGWWPTIFEGRLTLAREGAGWTAQVSFEQSAMNPSFDSLRIDGDRVHVIFRDKLPARPFVLEIDARLHDDRLTGEIQASEVAATPMGGRRHTSGVLRAATADHSLPSGSVRSTPALETLLDHARDQKSTAVVLVKDGKIVLEQYSPDHGPDEALVAMSGSNPLVSLAVGLLIADKKLSLDTSMGALFPEWKKQGAKGAITVRQLLTHTSGLDPSRADFEHKETIREHALKAKLLWPPGSRFQYNNGAVDFLAVVVHETAGMPLDVLLEERIFRKLDAVGEHWMKDAAGDPRGAGELFIRPVDLAKIGQMMLDAGKWEGEQVVPAEWVARSTEAGQWFDESCGMLWWRLGKFALTVNDANLAQWGDAGLDGKDLAQARKLRGKKYAGTKEYWAALTAALGEAAVTKLQNAARKGDDVPHTGRVADGPVTGFEAEGWLGQYLVVYPKSRVVAVRMRAPGASDYNGDGNPNGYLTFPEDVAAVF